MPQHQSLAARAVLPGQRPAPPRPLTAPPRLPPSFQRADPEHCTPLCAAARMRNPAFLPVQYFGPGEVQCVNLQAVERAGKRGEARPCFATFLEGLERGYHRVTRWAGRAAACAVQPKRLLRALCYAHCARRRLPARTPATHPIPPSRLCPQGMPVAPSGLAALFRPCHPATHVPAWLPRCRRVSDLKRALFEVEQYFSVSRLPLFVGCCTAAHRCPSAGLPCSCRVLPSHAGQACCEACLAPHLRWRPERSRHA